MYALTHSRPGVERTGHWMRFCLPAALLAGHHLLGKLSLPTALPLSLVEKATALSLSALAIIAEDIFNHSTPDNQGKPHDLNIDSIGVGAAAVISLYSLVSLARDATLLEGAGGFVVGGVITLWGAYNMSQSEVSDSFVKADRVALALSAVVAASSILFQPPSLHCEFIRESLDVPFRPIRLHGSSAVWHNLTVPTSLSMIIYPFTVLCALKRNNESYNENLRTFQLKVIPGFQSLWLGASVVALPLGLNKLKSSSDVLTIGALRWGAIGSSGLTIVGALATWVQCLLYTPPNQQQD